MNIEGEKNRHIESLKNQLKKITDIVFVDEESRNKNYDICLECDKYIDKDKLGGYCSVCLCNPALKTWIKRQHCPLEKWYN